MTEAELKNILKSVRVAELNYKDLCDEIQELNSIATKVTQYYSLTRTSGTSKRSNESVILRMIEKQYEAAEQLKGYLQQLDKIRELIQLLPMSDMQTVLLKRYYRCKRWDVIADEMAYSIRTIHRIHNSGIKKLLKLINDNSISLAA